ncbi:hypothetical protein INR49_029349 [Caranx melampygus]|nr:hypothetical protein INR49_029349 [Caranx melampygus]
MQLIEAYEYMNDNTLKTRRNTEAFAASRPSHRTHCLRRNACRHFKYFTQLERNIETGVETN